MQAPGNGSIARIPNKEMLEYEDEIEFECDRGFRMEGEGVSICTATGEWSTPPPTCHSKIHCSVNFLATINGLLFLFNATLHS